jgi:hypothetical protein
MTMLSQGTLAKVEARLNTIDLLINAIVLAKSF